jgi:hypothetical protein
VSVIPALPFALYRINVSSRTPGTFMGLGCSEVELPTLGRRAMSVGRATSLFALTVGVLGAACDGVTEPIDGNGMVVRETRPSDRIAAVRAVNFARKLNGDCNLVTVHVSGNGGTVVSVEAESNLVPYTQT